MAPRISAPLTVFLLGLAAAAFIYAGGLPGTWLYDDGPAIHNNPAIQTDSLSFDALRTAALSSDSGLFKRPLSMLSFAFNHYFTGLDPAGFKVVNIALHLAVAVGLALLAYGLMAAPTVRIDETRRRWLAVAAALAWLVHPLHVSTVLYTVQRMTELSALFTVAGLALYTAGRLRQGTGTGGTFLPMGAVLVFTPMAMLAKESGALLPVYAFVIEVCFFRFGGDRRARRELAVLFIAALALPAMAAALYTWLHPQWILAGYAGRDFTLGERLLTQARALLWYLHMILLPDIRQMGLFHDDFGLSTGWLQPAATLPAVATIVAMLAGTVALLFRRPVLAFAPLWFFAGHLLESTVFPLEPVYEHRNYLPLFGWVLTGAYAVGVLPTRHLKPRLAAAAGIVLVSLLAADLHLRVTPWSDAMAFGQRAVANHPESGLSQYYLATRYEQAAKMAPTAGETLARRARDHFLSALKAKPTMFPALVSAHYVAQRHRLPEPERFAAAAADALTEYTLSPAGLNALIFYTDCLVNGVCRDSSEDYLTVMLTAVGTVPGRGAKAMLLRQVGRYFGEGRNDAETALFYVGLALERDGRLTAARYDRIRWLLALGQADNALEELDRIENLDRLGTEKATVTRLRREIHQAMAQ